jgi:hypothetical protein
MASQSSTRSESVADFVPELEHLITEAMDEWKVPGVAVARTSEAGPIASVM